MFEITDQDNGVQIVYENEMGVYDDIVHDLTHGTYDEDDHVVRFRIPGFIDVTRDLPADGPVTTPQYAPNNTASSWFIAPWGVQDGVIQGCWSVDALFGSRDAGGLSESLDIAIMTAAETDTPLYIGNEPHITVYKVDEYPDNDVNRGVPAVGVTCMGDGCHTELTVLRPDDNETVTCNECGTTHHVDTVAGTKTVIGETDAGSEPVKP